MSIGWFLLSASIGMAAIVVILCVVDRFEFRAWQRDQTAEILRGLRKPTRTWTRDARYVCPNDGTYLVEKYRPDGQARTGIVGVATQSKEYECLQCSYFYATTQEQP